MQANYHFYASFLEAEKWVTKIDFIYKLKVHCDCSQPEHARFLRHVYHLPFQFAKRSRSGELIFT